MTLGEHIEAELDRREAGVRSCAPNPSRIPGMENWRRDGERPIIRDGMNAIVAHVAEPIDAEHIALHDPADALRRYAAARRVLERHEPINERPYRKTKCRHHAGAGVSWVVDWPCAEILDLADSLGISSEEGTQP